LSLVTYHDYVLDSIQDYKQGLGEFCGRLPEVGEKYMQLTAACFQGGALSEKDKHLIALGIAIHAQDEYCIMYHARTAMEIGADEQQILETVGVCAAFGGGAALSQGVTLVQDVIAGYQKTSH
jgi:AhpD family alkylhydroperoxidase